MQVSTLMVSKIPPRSVKGVEGDGILNQQKWLRQQLSTLTAPSTHCYNAKEEEGMGKLDIQKGPQLQLSI